MRRSRALTPQRPPDEGAERAADLHRRPLAPAGAAGAERAERGQGLDPDDAPPDDAAVAMEGVDRRVAAAAAGLGGEPRQQAAGEPAERREQDQQPGTEGRRAGPQGERLAVGAQDGIARQLLEQEVLEELDGGEEERADEARGDTDERRMQERAPDDPEIEGTRVRREAREQKCVAQATRDAVVAGLRSSDGPASSRG